MQTTIAPWLSVSNGAEAVKFYSAAFGAVEVYRLEDPDGGVIARLSISGAEFWVSHSPGPNEAERRVRIILTVDDPDSLFTQALQAGSVEVFPVSEAHGWRTGRLTDPFGFDWEIGRLAA